MGELDRRQIGALVVLDDLVGQQLHSLADRHDDRGDRGKARQLRCAEAALAQTYPVHAVRVGRRNRDRLQHAARRDRGGQLGERVIVEAAPGIAGVGQDARKFDILDPARPFMVADKKSELLDALVELAHQAAATSWLVMRPSISASTARISSAAALAPLPVSCHTGR